MRNRRVPRGLLGLLALMVLLLAGCIHIRQEVTLGENQQWKALMRITFPASTVEQLGEEMMQQQDQDFTQQKLEAEQRGVRADIQMRKEDNGDVVYEMNLEGQGWDLLNEFIFSDQATIADAAGGRVSFSYDATEFTAFAEMGGSYVLVLKGAEIHANNASSSGGGTATWENPTAVVEAELTPGTPPAGGGFPVWLIIVLVAVGVLLLVAVLVIVLVTRGRQSTGPAGLG